MSEAAKPSRRARKRAARMRLVVALVVLVVAAGAGGAWYVLSNRVDTGAMLEQARADFEAGEHVSAVINLKNVVSREPTNREARFLLGRAYLAAGDPGGAAKEFTRARELGESGDTLNLELARALVLSGKYDEAATEIAIYGDTGQVDWLVLRGMLDLGQQRIEDARATFGQVLETDPDNREARRGMVQVELEAGNAGAAKAEVERLVAAGDAGADVWVIKGELELHEERIDAAREAFARAVELEPQNPAARIGLARSLVRLEQLDAAANELDALGSAANEDPRVNFVRFRIAEARGDRNTALQHLRTVLQAAPMHRESLIGAAKLHFANGEYVRAGDYVARILELEPGNAAARRMLGAIQLASGRLEDVAGLGDIDKPAPDEIQNPSLLALLGTAYLKHGRAEDSRESLTRAAELAPDSLPIRTQLALSKMSTGDTEEAIADLRGIIEEDPGYTQARVMLTLAHLAGRDEEQALATAQAMRESTPENALAHNVFGYVNEVLGNEEAARSGYADAARLDAAFHPARINLARLAMQAGDVEVARSHFQQILDVQPFQPLAMQGLAGIALQEDDLDEAERLWQLAREHNPDAVAPRLLLARHYRAKGNMTLAESMVREAYGLAPYAPPVQAEYTKVMLQIESYEEALEAAQALTARVPDSVQGLELLAQVYNRLGDAEGLERTLERVAEIAPDAAPARVLLGRLALRRNDAEDARRIADALKADTESAALGYELEGDIAIQADDPEAAAAAYLRAYEMAPTSSNVIKLDRVERVLERSDTRLREWLDEHPDDLQVRMIHASYLQMEGDGSDAISHYEHVLETRGANPVALNNLAWLYHEAGDERALELARSAHEMAPEAPEIMDTYGWILFRNGQTERALELLVRARDLAPGNPEIRYHAAEALFASGDPAAARAELEAVLEEHATFPARADAEALRAKLDAQ